MTICRILLSFARVCRVGAWFGFVGSALLLAVGTCVGLSFEAMPGLCCFLRVTYVNVNLMNWPCPNRPLTTPHRAGTHVFGHHGEAIREHRPHHPYAKGRAGSAGGNSDRVKTQPGRIRSSHGLMDDQPGGPCDMGTWMGNHIEWRRGARSWPKWPGTRLEEGRCHTMAQVP